MNIFVLDSDPVKCAEYHCDKHLVKMITEHNQILGASKWFEHGITKRSQITKDHTDQFYEFPRKFPDGSPNPYGLGHMHHPCTKWGRECWENYEWLCKLTIEMCIEYTKRYGRRHAGEDICRWYYKNPPFLPLLGKTTPFAQAMTDECKNIDAVTAYRDYYVKYKKEFARWAHSETPEWFKIAA